MRLDPPGWARHTPPRYERRNLRPTRRFRDENHGMCGWAYTMKRHDEGGSMHATRVFGLVAAAGLFLGAGAAEDSKTVGRVKVTTVEAASALRLESVRQALTERFAAPEGRRFPEVRVVSLRPREDARFEATI